MNESRHLPRHRKDCLCLTMLACSSRRMQLLDQSRTWITAEDLDTRIEHALDNPLPLTGLVLPLEDKEAAVAARKEERADRTQTAQGQT